VRFRLFILLSFAVGACGLSLEGTDLALEIQDSGQPDSDLPADVSAQPVDAAADSRVGSGDGSDGARDEGDVAVEATPPSDACVPPPPAWSRLAFLSGRARPCPAATTTNDLIEGPTPAPNTCTCSTCDIVTHQSCASGPIVNYYDQSSTSASCGTTSSSFSNEPAGSCVDQGGTFRLRRHFRATPPGPTGTATCTASASAATGTVTASEVRTCTPSTPDSCSAVGVADCVAAPGNKTCPAPYTTKHLLGSDVEVTCGTCGCAVTTTCEGSITMSDHSSCSGGITTTIAVDDTCHDAPNTTGYVYAKYTGKVDKETCSIVGAAPPASVQLTKEKTVCCR